MSSFLSKIAVSILSQLASWIMAKVAQEVQKRQRAAETQQEIDAKLKRLKEAYSEARDGEEVTSEQRKKIQDAARDFIRNSGPGL